MKQLNIFLAFCALLFTASSAVSQRYVSQIFDEVQVTQGVIYGQNASIINLLDQDTTNDAHPLKHPLVMDIYKPVGDSETARPVVLYFHTGNFLPFPLNQVTGGLRTDSTAVEICTRLAKMGYVAASVDYRLGWNPYDPDELIRRWFLINAAYRGVQDARTAIRFFKKTAAVDNNPHGIDPAKIAIWGQGTGGYITLNTVALDNYSKTLIPKFLLPGPVPMVIEQINGNVEGTSVGQVPPIGYPVFTPGDTLCHINHEGYSSSFQLAVNMGGACGDSSWVDPGQPPLISFHVPTDSFAPYKEGIVRVPGTPFNVVQVQGSYLVQKLMNEFGNNDVFANTTWTDAYTSAANSRNDGYEGLYPFTPTDPGNSSPWDFYAASNPNATEPPNPVSARLYIDSIMNYFAPRACLALGLGCDLGGFTDTKEELNTNSIGLVCSPNPGVDYISFETLFEHPIEAVYIFDINGRLVKANADIGQNQFTLQRNSLPSGSYFAKLVFKNGFVTQQIMFR